MVRDKLGSGLITPEKDFRWRGTEITRLEGFTDAVFAFAVTLLVVSLEVPKTFDELLAAMKGFAAFAICFAVLVQIWHHHYIFFRRYGLQSQYTTFLNSALLFVVLFYVYPLKFLFTLTLMALFGGPLPPGTPEKAIILAVQMPLLIVIFSIGFTSISAVFALLYAYAYRKRAELELNEYELLITRKTIADQFVNAGFGIFVAITAVLVPFRYAPYTSLLLNLNIVYVLLTRPAFQRKKQAALQRIKANTA